VYQRPENSVKPRADTRWVHPMVKKPLFAALVAPMINR